MRELALEEIKKRQNIMKNAIYWKFGTSQRDDELKRIKGERVQEPLNV